MITLTIREAQAQNSYSRSPTEIISETKYLKTYKSTGFSSIPTKFLKLFQTLLREPISSIANIKRTYILDTYSLKTANVIPIFKKNDHTLYSNYRPISLISLIL